MKKFLLISFFITAQLNAHYPIINYELMTKWCSSIQSLKQDSLKTMHVYLQDLEAYATCCIQDPTCIATSHGKAMQQKIDEDIQAIMHDHDLIPIFEHLTMLIKEEVGQEKFTLLEQRKKEYELLAEIIQGCLDCLERKMNN